MYISPSTVERIKRVQRLLVQLRPESAPLVLCAPGSPEPHNNVVIFPGSFNPPTIAHLALMKQAERSARVYEPMQLYAAFSRRTVDKEGVERPLLVDRILLLHEVLHKRLPHAGILLFNRGLYVEQAQALRVAFPRVRRIFFLMGFDKIVQILDPHYYQDREVALAELFRLAELLVAPRGHDGADELQMLLNQPQNRRYARSIHPLPFDPIYRTISSTQIRQSGSVMTHVVPQEVRRFIARTRAYGPPVKRPGGSYVDAYAERVKQLEQEARLPHLF